MLAMALMATSDDNDVDRVTAMKKKYVGDGRMAGQDFIDITESTQMHSRIRSRIATA